LKSSDTVNTLLLARLRTMLQNQPTNERPQKLATEPGNRPHKTHDANAQNRCDRTSLGAFGKMLDDDAG
jgi:hypothetical protein